MTTDVTKRLKLLLPWFPTREYFPDPQAYTYEIKTNEFKLGANGFQYVCESVYECVCMCVCI